MNQDLPDDEVNSICAGLVQNDAKVRYLERLGLMVRIKPNGRPLVNRKHYDAVMNGSRFTPQRATIGIKWTVPT